MRLDNLSPAVDTWGMATEKTYCITRAAELLGVDRSRVHQFLDEGRIAIEPVDKHGGNWVIAHAELMRFKSIHRKPGRPRTKTT